MGESALLEEIEASGVLVSVQDDTFVLIYGETATCVYLTSTSAGRNEVPNVIKEFVRNFFFDNYTLGRNGL